MESRTTIRSRTKPFPQSGRGSKSRLINSASNSEEMAPAAAAAAAAGAGGVMAPSSSVLGSSFPGLGSSNPQNSLSALNIHAASMASAASAGSRPDLSHAASFDNNNSLRVGHGGSTKASKTANRWSGLWGSSAKVNFDSLMSCESDAILFLKLQSLLLLNLASH